jgi:hypothetical protein
MSGPVRTCRDTSEQVRTGRDMSRLVVRFRSGQRGQLWSSLDRLELVLTGPSMSGHVRTDRFRWGHVGTGFSGRTVQVGTGLDRTGNVGTVRDRSVHVSTCLDMSDQDGTRRDMLIQVFRNRTDMSGQVGTGLDSSRQFGYRSGRVPACRDRSGHFWTFRECQCR